MTYKYAISFTIGTGPNVFSYADRYASFMEQVRKTGAWTETTSFALTTTNETIDALADRLYFQSKFDATADLMIVIDIERGYAITKGKVEYPTTLSGKLNRLVQK